MKKQCILLVLFFQLFTLHPQENNTGVGIGFGFLGVGYSANTDVNDGYFFGQLINLTYQTEFGLGLTFSPIVFTMNFQDRDNFMLTFANGFLFYNFFKNNDSLILGLFSSIHAVEYRNPQFMEFHAGLMFSIHQSGAWDFFNSDLLLVEVGYKYNKTAKHGFYAHIGIDLLVVASFFGNANDVRDYEHEQKWR